MTLFASKSDIDLLYMKQALSVVVAIVAILIIIFIHTLGAWLFMCSLVITEIYFFHLIDKELYRRGRARHKQAWSVIRVALFALHYNYGCNWLDEDLSVEAKLDTLNFLIMRNAYIGKIGKGEWTQFREYTYCDGLKKYGLEMSKLNLS